MEEIAYNKVMAVIMSCITEEHFRAASSMVANYRMLYGDSRGYWRLAGRLYELWCPF